MSTKGTNPYELPSGLIFFLGKLLPGSNASESSLVESDTKWNHLRIKSFARVRWGMNRGPEARRFATELD